MWEYRCSVGRIESAVTTELMVDCGFNCYLRVRIRLMEPSDWQGRGLTLGPEEWDRNFTNEWISVHEDLGTTFPFLVRTFGCDEKGYWLAEIASPKTNETLNDALWRHHFSSQPPIPGLDRLPRV